MQIKKGAVLAIAMFLAITSAACSPKADTPAPDLDSSSVQSIPANPPVIAEEPEEPAPVPDTDSSEPSPAELADEPEESAISEPVTEEVYEPSEQEILALSNTWTYITESDDGLTLYRLMLMEQGEAQMPIQDEILQLLGLYTGSWTMLDANHISLTLTADRSLSKEITEGRAQIDGIYQFSMNTDQSITLTPADGSPELVPGSGTQAVTYHTAAYWNEVSEKSFRQSLCDAVLHYYEDITGTSYPGIAEVDSVDEAGYQIHLYEDVDDQVVTAGLYQIDPETYLGVDMMTDEMIDFSPYAEHSSVIPFLS